jgi:tripartite-type tricarboxylate transporter receptor subunit TctC
MGSLASIRHLSAALVASLAFGAAAPARAEDFYAGKTIFIIVSGGGQYEGYARQFARFMPKYIPGHPAMVVQQMNGGGGIRAANFMYKIAPKDGTYIAGTHGAVLTAPLLAPRVAEFDTTKFKWIGNATRDTYLGYFRTDTPIKTFEDVRKTEVIVGGTGVGGAGVDYAIIAKDMLGFKLKIVTGYKNSPESKLAMARGEIQGTMGNAISSLLATDLLEKGKVKVLLQHGEKPHRLFPDVPLFRSFARTDEERQVLDIMGVREKIAKPYFTPPGVPDERVEILRRAFDSTLADKDFLKEAEEHHMELEDSMKGAELTEFVRQVAATPPSVVKKLLELFRQYRK